MTSAVIVAAGRGTRMGPNIDKLFLEAAGAPIVEHTWKRFDAAPAIDEIILVVRAEHRGAFEEMAARFQPVKPFRLADGGQERQDSVWNGLQALSAGSEVVAIQDGARPCAAVDLIEATIKEARASGAAVAAQRVSDTIKHSDDGEVIHRHLDRSRLWAVQTPQTFQVAIIRRALTAVREKGLLVTDDTAACELIGQPVKLVESLQPNPKLTTASDLPWIEQLLRNSR